MFKALQIIAERKIQQAMEEGTLPDLSHWKNKPLPEDDFRNVPEEFRMAYRILKNSGYLPEGVEIRKEISRIEELLEHCRDEQERVKQLKKLDFLKYKIERSFGKKLRVEQDQEYLRKVVERLAVK